MQASRPESAVDGAKAGPSKNVAVTRKLQKVLDISMDDTFRESLEYLSSFYTENTAKDRKNLRGLLEHRALLLHEDFLAEFDKVHALFEATESDVAELAQLYDTVTERLQRTQREAAGALAAATALQTELREVTEKERQVNQFLQKFQLTAEERAALKGDINTDFFNTLAKVQGIHRNCKDLLNVNHQQAGIEIMEEMYMYQLSGFERLFKYAHKTCLDVMLTDSPEVTSNFVAALDALRERPALWVQCMQEVAKGRRTAVVRHFFDALSAGARPIEAHTADALRYVGNMLAWIHQAAAEESELLQKFFGSPSPYLPDPDGDEEPELTKMDLLDQIFEGLAKHLKVRMEQMLAAASGVQSANMVVLFKLENVLEFYSQAIPQLLGPSAALSVLLQDLKLSTMKLFFELLRNISTKLLSEQLDVPPDLTAPAVVHDSLEKLTAMMDTLSTSVIPQEEREAEFGHVLSAVVDPLVTLCANARSEDPTAKALFTLNALYTIQTTLSGYTFTKGKSDKLSALLEEEAARFAEEQAATVLAAFGIPAKLAAILDNTDAAPLSTLPATAEAAMAESLLRLYDHLAADGASVIPDAERLLSLRLRQLVQSTAARIVADAYDRLHAAAHDPANRYTDPATVAPLSRSPATLRDLLNVF